MSTELVVAEPTLEQLAATANREHALALEAGTAMMGHIIAAGEALIAARRQVPHGQWLSWLVENIDQAPCTVTQHMRLARKKDVVIDSQATTVKGALRLLRGEPQTRVDDPDERAAVLEMREAGHTYDQIAETLGTPRRRVQRWCNPATYQREQQRSKRLTLVAQRAERRAERDRQARQAGGDVEKAYTHIRRALQHCDRATSQVQDREARRAVQDTLNRLYDAEDAIVRASKLWPSSDVVKAA
jgi:predicted transcriptional regulator